MSGASAQVPDGPLDQSEESRPRKWAFLADPVVRAMLYAALGLTILFLATVVGVLATGLMAPTGPRSVAERELLEASARLNAAQATGETWAPYIQALVATGDLSGARLALSQARASVDTTVPLSDLDLAEARLLSARKDYGEAVSFADKAMKGYKASAPPDSLSYGADYDNAALVKAYALVELGRLKEAVAAFDIYIDENPTASDVLIDRGNAKARLNDKVGAERDFREALRFVPYDEEAKAGLKRIGVTE